MRRGPAPFEQPGLGEHERSTAHRRHSVGSASDPADPGDQRIVITCRDDPIATDHDEGVDNSRTHRPGGHVDHHMQATLGPHRTGNHCHRSECVGVATQRGIGTGEHFERPGQIERLEPRVHQEHDAMGRHLTTLAVATQWRQ